MGQAHRPITWKIGWLVVILKRDDPPGITGFLWLFTLKTAGNLFEKIIIVRPKEVFNTTKGSLEVQYGFRRDKSIVDSINKIKTIIKSAIVEILELYVKNVFNSVFMLRKKHCTICQLNSKRITIQNTFENRLELQQFSTYDHRRIPFQRGKR